MTMKIWLRPVRPQAIGKKREGKGNRERNLGYTEQKKQDSFWHLTENLLVRQKILALFDELGIKKEKELETFLTSCKYD